MTRARTLYPILLLVLSAATTLHAEWFDTYDEGLKAAQAENWQAVIQKMTQVIAQKPKENAKERTYGVNFIAYHPYYYRGMAYFNLGDWDKAIADLKKATGSGRVNLGSIEGKLAQAEAKLAPPPVQVTQTQPPVVIPPVTQTAPTVDPG
ncbi:MAG TPA: tetratricopeptide repeat protein, partial [Thermoanaerobaculia bacterium]